MAEKIFGKTIKNSAGRRVPVRFIGEQHVREDLGRIPTIADWFSKIKPELWMLGSRRDLEKEVAEKKQQQAKKKAARRKRLCR